MKIREIIDRITGKETPVIEPPPKVTVTQKIGVVRSLHPEHYSDVDDPAFWEICRHCFDYTLLPVDNLWSLYCAVQYICRRDIPGDLIECGVFLGGSLQLIAETLAAAEKTSRDERSRKIWAYDTFGGFVRRSDSDTTFAGDVICDYQTPNFRHETEANLFSVPYRDRIHIVEGDVTETMKTRKPDRVSLLRLDTDSYDTTLAELQILYPRLSVGGVLIIDDYGYCKGARQAVEEYFADPAKALLFMRSDSFCRLAVKI